MKKFTMLLVCLAMFGIHVANAQQRTITGTVTSAEDGMGLPGVSVSVKGTTLGAATDIDGKYALKVPQDAQILVFSSVGMQTQEITIGASNNISVVMKASTVDVDEVMVVAYGTVKKSSFTGSAASVPASKLEKIQTSDASKALEGVVSGVTISSASGSPGSDTQIRIRGIGSINASSEPLIIVDGSPYPAALSTINSADIASFNVLKDAASAALYGARGANGVVLITTKSAKAGKTVVNFDGKVGYNYRGVPEYDIIKDPATYYETFWQSLYHNFIYDYGLPEATAATIASGHPGAGLIARLGYNIYNVPNNEVVLTNGKINPNASLKYKDGDWNDWAKLLYEPRIRQEYNLSVSKGTEKSKIFFSAGYLNDKGYNINTYFKRLTTRLKYNGEIYPWLKFENNIQYTNTDRNAIIEGNNYTNTFSWTRYMPPIYPVYKRDINGDIVVDPFTNKKVYDDGTVNFDPNGNLVNGARAYAGNMNLVATQREDMREFITDMLTDDAGLTVLLPFDFELSSNLTLSKNWNKNTRFQTPILGDALAFGGRSTKTRTSYTSLNFNQILRWSKRFDNNLEITGMLGHESFGSVFDYFWGTKTGFLDTRNTELDNGTKIEGLGSYKRGYSLEGYFSQFTFAYMNKYYLSLSGRRDASSVFHPDHRWGNFWSVGGSWRVSQEDFYESIKEWVPNLKVKASYGAQGNDFLFDATGVYRNYSPYQNLYTTSSDGSNIAVLNTFMGNKKVTWETNLNLNAGIEFSLKNDVLTGEIDFFQRKTTDMLFNLPVPQSTGFTSKPVNIGNMENTGVEITLGSRVLDLDNFKWNVNANATHYKNKITKLPDEFKKDGIIRGVQRLKEGGSIYDFYVVKWGGVDPKDGNALYMLKNKKEDTEYKAVPLNESKAQFSKQTIGTSLPYLQGGFGTDFEFFGFDLSAQFSYALGGLVYDAQYANLMDPSNNDSNWHKDILDSWKKGNENSSLPRLEIDNRKLNYTTDRFLTDASYLAFRNVTLGYTLPKNIINKAKIQYVRVYFVVDNVALWSKRKGLDPRMSISGAAGSASYSPIRTASFGINVKF